MTSSDVQPTDNLVQPPKLVYRNGDDCYIYSHEFDEDGKQVLSHGKVLLRFTVADMLGVFYIIRLGDPDYPYLEVRDALTMTPDPRVLPPFNGTATPLKDRPANTLHIGAN